MELCGMKGRVLRHILFWLLYLLLYAVVNMLFPASSDLDFAPVERFFRFFFRELAFLPWKIIPFYFLFYFLLPKYLDSEAYLRIGLYFSLILLVCLVGYRSMIAPMSHLLYGDLPEFNVYSFRRFLYSAISDILPAIGLASTVKLLRDYAFSRQRAEALKKEKLESELHFLKAQTNPHFLFNTLNNLYGLARKDAPNSAPYILKLASILRYILQECNVSSIPIAKEIRLIQDYLDLEQLRYQKHLEITFEKMIEDETATIAPLLLLPFVENAFKHGISEARFHSFIHLKLQVSKEHIQFICENSKEETDSPSTLGIGLQNVKRQLELTYENAHELHLEERSDIFKICLKILRNT